MDIRLLSKMANPERYEVQFKIKAQEAGFSSEYIEKCLGYAIPLISKGLPVVYNIKHLSGLVGYNVSYLKRAIKFPDYFYRKFHITKKNGKKRVLYEPLPSLKEIQLWILKEILSKNQVSRYAKAYVPKRSIKEHVIYHTDEATVLTLDIRDFFGSIQFETVENIFLEMGYSKRVSNLLTKLCFRDKSLPQGAPTSPYISNLILKDFDKLVSSYCLTNGIKYTRYADDMAFSGKLNISELELFVQQELKKVGLNLNHGKRKLMKANGPQIISGIMVNKKAQLPRRVRNSLRNEMHYIVKYGLENHMKHTNQDKVNYLEHLIGKINYVLHINPRDEEFQKYKEHLYSLK